jgi:hypothetical protein
LAAAALRQIEPGKQESAEGEPDRGDARHGRVGAECDEHEQPGDGKQKLGRRLDEDIDDDAGGGERPWNGIESQQARSDHIAADLRHGQQDVGRLAHEAQDHADPQLRSRLGGEQHPPPDAGDRDRGRAHHDHQRDSPADAGNRVGNRIQADPNGDGADGGDPGQPGDNTGLRDHLRSRPLPGRFEVKGGGCTNSYRQLVRRAPLHNERRACGIAGEPLVFEERVRCQPRRPEVTRLRAGSVRPHAAPGIEYRQTG